MRVCVVENSHGLGHGFVPDGAVEAASLVAGLFASS
jgi:hypothetical protein